MKRFGIDRDGTGATKEDVVEAEVYKERLRDMEVAFRYNLGLLSERDAELDMLEEQLRSGIDQFERLSHEKAVYEELLKRVDDERNSEIRTLTDRLTDREKKMRELERRNEGSTIALKKKLEDVKKELSEERARYEKEIARIEKNCIRAVQLKEAENMEEVNRLNRKHMKQMDEIERERRGFESVRVENKKLKKDLLRLQREREKRERSHLREIQQLNHLYGSLRQEMERERTKAKVSTKEISTWTEEVETAAGDEVDRREFLMIQEQNDVLKSIIKNLKRNRGKDGRPECGECLAARDRVKKLESEVDELRDELEREKSQRLEEEAIIQNLESSVVCLKEKLLTCLRRSFTQAPASMAMNEVKIEVPVGRLMNCHPDSGMPRSRNRLRFLVHTDLRMMQFHRGQYVLVRSACPYPTVAILFSS